MSWKQGAGYRLTGVDGLSTVSDVPMEGQRQAVLCVARHAPNDAWTILDLLGLTEVARGMLADPGGEAA